MIFTIIPVSILPSGLISVLTIMVGFMPDTTITGDIIVRITTTIIGDMDTITITMPTTITTEIKNIAEMLICIEKDPEIPGWSIEMITEHVEAMDWIAIKAPVCEHEARVLLGQEV